MPQPWDSPERDITPQRFVLSRRRWLIGAGVGLLAAGGIGGGLYWWHRGGTDRQVLLKGQADNLYPELYENAAVHPSFSDAGRPLTKEADAARFCNFYEFTSSKNVWRYVDLFEPIPWTIEVSGLVRKPRTFDLDDLHKEFPLEERIYRHRCVEAWAMVVPWIGFPLAALLKKIEPLNEARYLRFTSFERPSEAPHQRDKNHPWPYTEGLTIAEANSELAFVATGMYGHSLLKQHGAPCRIVVPWKFGFKSAKSVVRIELTDSQPATFWNILVPSAYGFEANVKPESDPNEPHPSWSQSTEKMLDTGERFATKIYNGYGEWVAKLYA